MTEETIWLRGGPLNDEFIAWRGGNEVQRDFVIDLVPGAPDRPGVSYPPATALHRRSADDHRRFDFVGLVDHSLSSHKQFERVEQMLSGQRWTADQADQLINLIRKGVG
jgi:hypothetical protein